MPSQHWYLALRLLADREVDETDDDGNTLLHLAAAGGQLDAIQLAVTSGASLVVKNKEGKSPYQLAQRREKTTERFWISHSWIPYVHKACRGGRIYIVKFALCYNADVDTRIGNTTLLHSACNPGSHEVATLLLSLGAVVNARDCFDETPLHLACWHGNVDTVRLLLDHGAEDSLSHEGLTAFHRACMNGHIYVVRLFIQRGADIHVKVRFDYTALHMACIEGHEDIVWLLLTHGADSLAKNKMGTTPMDIARMYGHDTLVNLLSTHSASSSVFNPPTAASRSRKGVLSKLFH